MSEAKKDPRDGAPGHPAREPAHRPAPGEHPGRRALLKRASWLGGGLLASTLLGAGRAGAREFPVQAHPTKALGRPIGENDGYGTRSQFETVARFPFPTPTRHTTFSLTPLEEMRGILTPSGLHFERHHAGIPNIDPATHELMVHGMVERPMRFTMSDLERFPCVSRIQFIECSGNSFSEWKGPTFDTVQKTHGLTSTSEWAGVPLSTLLAEVGVQPGARWLLAEGRDGGAMSRSLPLDKAWEDVLVAYQQNGEALRPEQGYPLRLVVPGWEGNVNVKWLRRIEVSDRPFMTRDETSHYTDLLADGTARQFSFVMEAKSVITFPSGTMQLDGPGFYEITGIAWSGRGAIRQVDVSTDGGRTWHPAALEQPVLPQAHTRFRFPWRWDGEPALLQSRCTDETGYTQPTRAQLLAARGGHGRFASIYHFNGIQTWKVNRNGKVDNAEA